MKIALILLFSVSFTTTAMADRFTDAMEIAIQHFSSDASKDIRSWGPEHSYVYRILQMIDAKVPAVAGISLGISTHKYSALNYHSEYGISAEEVATEVTALNKTLEKIISKCPKKIETKTVEAGTDETKLVETYRTTTYTLDYPSCASKVAPALVKAGINQIKTQTNETNWRNSYSFEFSQTVNTYRDMRYVRSQLEQIEELDQSLVKKLKAFGSGDEMEIGGKAADIILENSSGQGTLGDVLTLTYMKGWGDCPAGCIHHHYWTITAQELHGKFIVEVKKEWGDSISDKDE